MTGDTGEGGQAAGADAATGADASAGAVFGGMSAVRYMLTVAYDGTEFCGWQKQEPPLAGVQAESDAEPSGESSAGLALTGGAQPDGQASGAKVANASQPDGEIFGPRGPLGPERVPAMRAYAATTPLIPSDRAGRASLRTVQGVVERAVREVVRERVELVGASRTDSGVHARGQVCAFTSRPDARGTGWPRERGPERLVMALNARLDRDVLVRHAEVVQAGFNPIAGAVRKRYTYTFCAGGQRPLWDRGYVCWVKHGSLDAHAMHEAAQTLVGEHDFASFAATGHGRLSTVRTVFACGVELLPRPGAQGLDAQGLFSAEDNAQRVVVTIEGNGFLWNMVRIVAGTLLRVGLGQRPTGWVSDALLARDRASAGPTAPPTGLCLERIWYAEAGGVGSEAGPPRAQGA